MPQIPQHIIDKVLDIDIIDVVSKVVDLKRRGVNYVGLCPFHTDNTPSFYVSPSKGICKCFACGEGGNVIVFTQKHEGLSYPEAIRLLARSHNIDIPEVELTPEQQAKEKQTDAMFISLKATQQQFVENIKSNTSAMEYVQKKRGFTPDTVEEYGIGYAATGNQLASLLPQKGYSRDILSLAGVLSQNENGSFYDRFQERIVFPFFDIQGRVIGFTGRDLSGTSNAKYLNSPATDMFDKSSAIFGLFQARKRIAETGCVHIVEGQADVVSFAQNGLKNTVAGSGTAFSERQAKTLKRFADTVILIYDGDPSGTKAALKQIKLLLSFGFVVKCFSIPEGMDPDDLARKLGPDQLPTAISKGAVTFEQYIYKALSTEKKEKEDKLNDLDIICERISVIPDKLIQKEYIKSTALLFGMSASDITARINPPKEINVEQWKDGFYGIDETVELLEADPCKIVELTFDKKRFSHDFGIEPVIYVHATPCTADIQVLRSKIKQLYIIDEPVILPSADEPAELSILKEMFKEGIDIQIDKSIFLDESDYNYSYPENRCYTFTDFYVTAYSKLIASGNGSQKGELTARVAHVIANLDATVREVMLDEYAKTLGLKKTVLTNILKPLLAAKKDKSVLETQRLNEVVDIMPIDPDIIPDYVSKNEVLMKNYIQSGYYPLMDKDQKRFVAYMFKNQQGGSHINITDFYMEPLLHIYDKDSRCNKAVIRLCHIHRKYDKYVEWPRNVFANLNKVHEKLIEEGAYNFEGTAQQFKKIWKSMSYNFTTCTEIRIFGQQPEGFFAFGNAIFHKVTDSTTGEETFRVDYTDRLGIVSHNAMNYYSPAFSEIYLSDRSGDNIYKQARNLRYKDIPAANRLSFDNWASLMNDVYSINDNGKWAILYAIACAFCDFIFGECRQFTTLFFIGPTSSGKTQIAESIRNLFMDADTPSFNLNTGTDAAFFMILESLRNIPVVMEEYNDKDISPNKFQGLKSATLDREGKIKVKDTASKTMDSSEINACLIPLGQEAPALDDGALSNRCILCNVPYRKMGEFTEKEIEVYERLKKHERTGLCNVLVEVLKLRPVFEKEYMKIYNEEKNRLKEAVKVNIVNTEGFTRILNSVSLLAAVCKLIEEQTILNLPFTYESFFGIATNKILTQLESIATTNKLSTYFSAISTLITRGKVIIGREIKVLEPDQSKVTITLSGKKTEVRELPSGTRVLYINTKLIYPEYLILVGKDQAATQQTLDNYFTSCSAYIGWSRSQRFKWLEAVYDMQGDMIAGSEETINTAARLKMKYKTEAASAHIFDYDMLKSLFDIDFERIEDLPSTPQPEPEGLPF